MAKFQAEVTIDRPVAEVFNFVADPASYSKWMNGVSEARLDPGAQLGTGARVQSKGKTPLGAYEAPMEITEYVPNRQLGIKATIPGKMEFQGRWVFEPNGDSATRITTSGETHLLGAWRLAEPLMGGEIQKGEAEELKRIKQLLENRSP